MLDKSGKSEYSKRAGRACAAEYGVLAQLGERKVRNLEVRGSIPLYSTMQKALAFASAFCNDVCPVGQMICASHMMLPSAMMCPAGHEGQTSHHCEQSEQHHFGAKRRNIIRRIAPTSFNFIESSNPSIKNATPSFTCLIPKRKTAIWRFFFLVERSVPLARNVKCPFGREARFASEVSLRDDKRNTSLHFAA